MAVDPIYKFEFPFKTYSLLTEMDKYQDKFKAYSDIRYNQTDDNWLILKNENFKVLTEECRKFLEQIDLEGIPRYYILKANSILRPHVDYKTKCSINHLLSTDSASVTYTNYGDFKYKTALLNTSEEHSVDNRNYSDRYIFKISFFNHSYEEVKEKIIAYEIRTKI